MSSFRGVDVPGVIRWFVSWLDCTYDFIIYSPLFVILSKRSIIQAVPRVKLVGWMDTVTCSRKPMAAPKKLMTGTSLVIGVLDFGKIIWTKTHFSLVPNHPQRGRKITWGGNPCETFPKPPLSWVVTRNRSLAWAFIRGISQAAAEAYPGWLSWLFFSLRADGGAYFFPGSAMTYLWRLGNRQNIRPNCQQKQKQGRII